MAKIVEDITKLIGDTPLVKVNKLVSSNSADIWGKCEFLNPGFSVKDRIGLSMIEDAERKGILKKGDTIIEPTSGNTGNGLALVAAKKGYKLIVVVPDFVSVEKRRLLKAYGAEVIIASEERDGIGMIGAVKIAEKLVKEKGYFMPMQFENMAGPRMHYETTGPEIYEVFKDIGLDYFIAGIGTGGTISGAGKFLREKFPKIKIYAVEPAESPVFSGGCAAMHKIQGIGPGFFPKTLDRTIYDDVITVSYKDATQTAKMMARKEGVLIGMSAGAITFAGLELAKGKKGKNMVVIWPDSGERYLSTDMYDD